MQPCISVNRLFYFAIPPSVYAQVAAAIHAVGISKEGFTRMIIEKPFGHDLDSAKELSKKLERHFTEVWMKDRVKNLSFHLLFRSTRITSSGSTIT